MILNIVDTVLARLARPNLIEVQSAHPLHGIGGPTTRSKTKRMKQALQGLILKIKEKEDPCELRVASNWVTFLQIDEDALRPT